MKKSLKAVMCSAAVFGMLLGNVQGVFADEVDNSVVTLADATYSISVDKTDINVGDTFTVTVSVKNNPGINAITGYLNYNPEYVVATEANETNSELAIMTKAELDAQLSLKPSSTNEDYKDLGADGVKTAAELGRIKVAGFLSKDNALIQSTTDADVFSFTFKALKSGSPEIEFVNLKTSNYNNGTIDTTEVSNAKDTTTTVNGGSEGNYKAVLGDVTLDKEVKADDITSVIKTIVNIKVDELSADMKKIADYTKDGNVDAADVTAMIKKVVNDTPNEEVSVSTDLYAGK